MKKNELKEKIIEAYYYRIKLLPRSESSVLSKSKNEGTEDEINFVDDVSGLIDEVYKDFKERVLKTYSQVNTLLSK